MCYENTVYKVTLPLKIKESIKGNSKGKSILILDFVNKKFEVIWFA